MISANLNESPFSLSRPLLILHLLSASSTLGMAGGLAQFPHPAQLTQLRPPVPSLQGPELQCSWPLQEPILWHLQFGQEGPWSLTPFEDSCPQPGATWKAHLLGPLPPCLAGSPHVLPGTTLLGVFT